MDNSQEKLKELYIQLVTDYVTERDSEKVDDTSLNNLEKSRNDLAGKIDKQASSDTAWLEIAQELFDSKDRSLRVWSLGISAKYDKDLAKERFIILESESTGIQKLMLEGMKNHYGLFD